MTPPVVPDTAGSPFDDMANIGVPVAGPFPRWRSGPHAVCSRHLIGFVRVEARTRIARTEAGMCISSCHKTGRSPSVVPARFLVACERGHSMIFRGWSLFIAAGLLLAPSLRLYELGDSGEVVDIQVKCVRVEANRRMADAHSAKTGKLELALAGAAALIYVKYESLWLRGGPAGQFCSGASNSWFRGYCCRVSYIPTGTDRLGATGGG